MLGTIFVQVLGNLENTSKTVLVFSLVLPCGYREVGLPLCARNTSTYRKEYNNNYH